MCKVKEGIAVASEADLQNLITSIILRQATVFTIKDIMSSLEEKVIGSKFEKSSEIGKKCEDTISALALVDCLKHTDEDSYKLAVSFPSVP